MRRHGVHDDIRACEDVGNRIVEGVHFSTEGDQVAGRGGVDIASGDTDSGERGTILSQEAFRDEEPWNARVSNPGVVSHESYDENAYQ